MSTEDETLVFAADYAARIATQPSSVNPVEAGELAGAVFGVVRQREQDLGPQLGTVLALLHYALGLADDRPEAVIWKWDLGLTYTERAGAVDLTAAAIDAAVVTATLQDWDSAVFWLEAALRDMLMGRWQSPADGEASGELSELLALDLAGARWEQRSAQIEVSDDPATLGRQATLLIAELTPLARLVNHRVRRAELDALIGLGSLSRYQATDEEAALHHGIDVLSGAVVHLAAEDGLSAAAYAALGELLGHRYLDDDQMSTLDESIGAAGRAVALSDSDDPAWARRNWLLGTRLSIRFNDAAEPDPADRERAIDCLTVALETLERPEDEPATCGDLGFLLGTRGMDTDSEDDLRAGVRLLRIEAMARPDWLSCTVFAAACYELAVRTEDNLDWAEVITAAATALTYPAPEPRLALDDVLHRMLAMAGVTGNDMRLVLESYPVGTWLDGDVALILAAARDEETDSTLLSVCALLCSIYAAGRAAELVTTSTVGFRTVAGQARAMLAVTRLETISDEPTLSVASTAIGGLLEALTAIADEAPGHADTDGMLAALRTNTDQDMRDMLAELITLSESVNSLRTGSLDTLRAVGRETRRQVGVSSTQDAADLDIMARLFTFTANSMTGKDPLRRRGELTELAEAIDRCSSPAVVAPFAAILAALRNLSAAEDSGVAPEDTTPVPPDDPTYVLWRLAVLVPTLGLATQQQRHTDVSRVVAELDALRPRVDPTHPILGPAANWMFTIADGMVSALRPGDRARLDQAITEYERLIAEYSRGNPFLIESVAGTLGGLLRTRGERGDRGRSREVAIDAMAALAWRVLVQSDTADALAVATSAIASTDQVLTWCVEDRAHDDLVRFLEAQRGLVLHAATTNRDVATRLRDQGEDDLAVRWAEAGGFDRLELPGLSGTDALPINLRARVLRVLGDTLLRPPPVSEIQRALAVHGADVLIYLVPPGLARPAYAVAVPREGHVDLVPLPNLTTHRGSPVADYVAAYTRWHSELDEDKAADAKAIWRAKLSGLCDWAGRVVGVELRRLAARHAGTGCTPRLVLTAMGMLGMVPWHAIRVPTATGPRFLLQDVCVCYTPSARLLAEVAARAPVVGETVLVGDPAANLPAAGPEVAAIRESFYPKAKFLGGIGTNLDGTGRERAQDGWGTVAEVTSVLRNGVELFHLAAHALARMDAPHESYFQLEDESELTANTLLRLNPTGDLSIGIAVLACCMTSLSGTDYDEALSLASTMLVVGARSVVGSLWSVPDRNTAYLTYQFHRNLMAGMNVAESLRQAQLWMLDPDADIASIPERITALEVPSTPKDNISEWAAFLHMGSL